MKVLDEAKWREFRIDLDNLETKVSEDSLLSGEEQERLVHGEFKLGISRVAVGTVLPLYLSLMNVWNQSLSKNDSTLQKISDSILEYAAVLSVVPGAYFVIKGLNDFYNSWRNSRRFSNDSLF